MPGLEYQRLVVTGERHQRDVSQKCNQIGDAVGLELDALKARVNTLETAIVELRVAAQGSMYLATPEAGSDITGAFQIIDHYDTIGMTARGCTLNTSTGEFTLGVVGSWLMLIRVNLTHNESNSGRETFIRLFNVSESTASASAPIAIGRNTPGTSDTPVLAFDFVASQIGDTYRVEIGGGDTLTTVTWEAANVVLSYQGELGSLV